MTLDQIQALLNNWTGLGIWLALVAASVAWVIYDLKTSNSHIASMMRWVWGLTVL